MDTTNLKSSPTTVIGVYHGPADNRSLFLATTPEAAEKEIGKRAVAGNPVVNPELVEMPVVGDPDPKSLEALAGRVTTGIQEAVKTFTGPDSPFRHL